MKPYPLGEDLGRPVLRVAMPRAPRVIALPHFVRNLSTGGTMHAVARCNNREFYFTSTEDFELLLAHLHEMVRSYEATVYAYTLMSNHVHLLMQAPTHEALGRPLRWFMTETARAFHKDRGRRGHFWERRYRACLAKVRQRQYRTLRPPTRNLVRMPATSAGRSSGPWGARPSWPPMFPKGPTKNWTHARAESRG